MYRVLSAVTTVAIVAASVLLFSGTAYAHEERTLGNYKIEVGWLIEPAFVGQLNGLDLSVTNTRTNQAVSGLEKTLTVDVSAGGLKPFPLTVSARFDVAGAYDGSFVPTVTGSYTFHIVGKIDTMAIDEKFTSGPNTFDDINDVSALQYPTKVPVGDALRQRLDAIASGVDQTRLIALAALALSVVALGAIALAGRRRA